MGKDQYFELCTYDNLFHAYEKARKHKTQKDYVIEFEKDLKNNLLTLRSELLFHTYHPEPLKTFIIRDPKTRTISKSAFRDRVIHHALCNIIAPVIEKQFIQDSFANQKGKGTLAAIQRLKIFLRKATKNFSTIKGTRNCKGYSLKADIRHFFQSVPHEKLVEIIKKSISDTRVIWLVKVILANHKAEKKGIGMPLGNLTSQFFANVYLNELDHYVKHELRAKYYIRYVDDFVILHHSKEQLEEHKEKIEQYLKRELHLDLHPEKSRIFPIYKGTGFLGFRVFPHHILIKKQNLNKFKRKCGDLNNEFNHEKITYDDIYDFLEGWTAYSKYANVFKLRKRLLTPMQKKYAGEISTKEYNRLKKYAEPEEIVKKAVLSIETTKK